VGSGNDRPSRQRISPQFPGVLVGPPRVRKCHRMSSKEHIQLGWVVRWVLSTPPGPPRGWAVCTCRASTSLAPLYSPCASSAFDWGSKPHSRSAPAPVESSPGPLTHCPFHRFFILETAGLHFEPCGSKTRSRPQHCLEPRAGTPRAARRAKRSHARRHIGVLRTLSTKRTAQR
jgi:hypothetical protein